MTSEEINRELEALKVQEKELWRVLQEEEAKPASAPGAGAHYFHAACPGTAGPDHHPAESSGHRHATDSHQHSACDENSA